MWLRRESAAGLVSGPGPQDQSWLAPGTNSTWSYVTCARKSNDLNLTEDDEEEEGSVSSNPPPL